MKSIILIASIAIHFSVVAQQKKASICNQFTDLGERYKKMIPKDFCMPEGYVCYYFINDVDLTADGKNDLVIHWRKKKQIDGDTTFVSIFQRINDSTLIHKSTLSNLYATYLDDYSVEYAIKKPYKPLMGKQTKLESADQFKVEFRKNMIWIEIFTEPQAGVNLYFSYNFQKKNWYLTKEVDWFGDNLKVEREIRETKIIKNGIQIQKFNMFDFL